MSARQAAQTDMIDERPRLRPVPFDEPAAAQWVLPDGTDEDLNRWIAELEVAIAGCGREVARYQRQIEVLQTDLDGKLALRKERQYQARLA